MALPELTPQVRILARRQLSSQASPPPRASLPPLPTPCQHHTGLGEHAHWSREASSAERRGKPRRQWSARASCRGWAWMTRSGEKREELTSPLCSAGCGLGTQYPHLHNGLVVTLQLQG